MPVRRLETKEPRSVSSILTFKRTPCQAPRNHGFARTHRTTKQKFYRYANRHTKQSSTVIIIYTETMRVSV